MEATRETLISEYFREGFRYNEIIEILQQHHAIVLSLRHLKRILKNLNLKRRSYTEAREAVEFIRGELRSSGQLHGYRIMYERCRRRGINVRMDDVRFILKQLDPEGCPFGRPSVFVGAHTLQTVQTLYGIWTAMTS